MITNKLHLASIELSKLSHRQEARTEFIEVLKLTESIVTLSLSTVLRSKTA